MIPFYQRQRGLLQACMASVMRQACFAQCHVMVVDDGSPVPAREELAQLLEQHANIQLVEQPNGGPSAARNRGLDSLPAGMEVVAFLDPDDVWEPWHLDDALLAFDGGCDLYFANTMRYSNPQPRFDWAHGSGRRLDSEGHAPIDAHRPVRVFQGDFFDFALSRSAIISSSTFAYRYATLADIRFQRDLRWGEDRYFKLEVAKRARRVAYSTRVSAVEGQGVNIFDSAQWGSVDGLHLLLAYMQMTRKLLKEMALTQPQRTLVRSQLAKYRYDFSLTVAHLLRGGTMVPLAVWRRAAQVDPVALAQFVPNLTLAVLGRLLPRNRGAS